MPINTVFSAGGRGWGVDGVKGEVVNPAKGDGGNKTS